MSDIDEMVGLALEAQKEQAGVSEDAPPEGTAPEGAAEPAEAAQDEPPAEEPPPEADAARKRQRDLDRQAEDLRKKHAKIQAKLAKAVEAERRTAEIQREIDSLKTSDARAILSSFAKLTGRDPIHLYREWGVALATDGKGTPAPEKTPAEIAAVKAEIDALKKSIADREAAASQSAQAQAVETRVRSELNTLVVEPSLPELAAYAQAVGPEKAAAEMLAAMRAKAAQGERITTLTICRLADAGLRTTDWRKSVGAPLGSETQAAPAAKTEQEQSTPRGRSLAPSVATQATRSRPLTDEERYGEQLKLMDGVLAEMGL